MKLVLILFQIGLRVMTYFSLYYRKIHKGTKKKPEGIVFYSPSKNKLAKLRLDMFDWYKGRRHRI